MNNNINFNLDKISIYIFIGLLVLIILSPFNPNNIIPGKDSGAFLYMGQQILNGDIPYRDFWDHKGPIIYYINALSLWLGQGTIWGLWGIQFVSLYISGLVGYVVIRRAFGSLSAIFATTIWILSSFYVIRNGGNSTEEFSILLSFVSLYLFVYSRESNRKLFYIFIIGSLLSLSFLLRANNIAVQLSILIYIICSRLFKGDIKKLIVEISAFALGSIAILAGVLFYFKSNNALDAFIDQAFMFNFLYSDSSLGAKLNSFYSGLNILAPSGIAIIAIAAWIFGLIKILNRIKLNNKAESLLSLSIIALPLTFLFSILSGRPYPHYYITWLPILAVLVGYLSFELINGISNRSVGYFNKKIKLSVILICSLLISTSMHPLLSIITEDRLSELKLDKWESFKNTISKYSKDENYIYMWGPQMSLFNFLLKKKSPSRYFYLRPLLTCGYVNNSIIKEFTEDIKHKKPLIVETYYKSKYSIEIQDNGNSKTNIGFVEVNKKYCPDVKDYYELTNFINSNYKIVASHKDPLGGGWNIYKYNNRN